MPFYTSVPKIMIICYTVLEIWCVTDVVIFYFGLFFSSLGFTPYKAEQPLRGMELQEMKHKKDYRIQNLRLKDVC